MAPLPRAAGDDRHFSVGESLDDLGDHAGHDLHEMGIGCVEHFLHGAHALRIQGEDPLHRQKSQLPGGADDGGTGADDAVHAAFLQILQAAAVLANAFCQIQMDEDDLFRFVGLPDPIPDGEDVGFQIDQDLRGGVQRLPPAVIPDGRNDGEAFQPVFQFVGPHGGHILSFGIRYYINV